MIYPNTKFIVKKSWGKLKEGFEFSTNEAGDGGFPDPNRQFGAVLLSPAMIDIALELGFIDFLEKPWKPKEGEEYWYISEGGNVFENSRLKVGHKEVGNYFKTEQAAKNAAEKVKTLLSSLHKE